MQKFFDYLIILILFFILAFSPWYYGSVRIPAQYLIHLSALAALLLWLIKTNLGLRKFNYYPEYLPLLCLLVVSLLSILFSVHRYASIVGFLNLFTYIIVLFLVSQTIDNEKRIILFIYFLILSGLFYCAYGILQYRGVFPKDFWTQPESLSSRFVNSGPFGAFINLPLFLSIGMLFFRRNIFIRLVSILSIVVFLVTLILSKSRISWLVFAITLAIFLFLVLKKQKMFNIKGTFLIFIFFVFLIFIFWLLRSVVLQRIIVAQQTQFQSLFQRFDVWRDTIRMIFHRPFGTGIDTFKYIYLAFKTQSDRFIADTAHSDFLQIASELGIIGLALFLWFLVKLFIRISKGLFGLPNQRFFLGLGIVAAPLSFLLQSALDFPLQIPANAIFLYAALALLVTYIGTDNPPLLTFKKYLTSMVIIFLSICAMVSSLIYFSDKYFRMGERDLKKMDLLGAISNYNKSIKLMPIRADNYAQNASVMILRMKLAGGEQKEKLKKSAIYSLERAVRLNPFESDYYLSLARLYVEAGRQKEAIFAFNKVIETNPSDGASYYPYAEYCLTHNLPDKALATYHKAFSLFTEELRFRQLCGNSYYELFDKIYVYVKDYNQLKQIIPENNIGLRFEFANFLERKGLFSASLIEYKKILSESPDYAPAKSGLERVEGKI